MTTSHLYCIFNANDPTPTAIAIRSLNFQSVTVYVIGHDSFSEPQRKNLDPVSYTHLTLPTTP